MALLAGAGAAGCSIEDYDPATGRIDDVGLAGERVAIAAEAAHGLPEPMVLTGRAENHIVAVVKAVGAPLNVLALPHGPTLAELGSVGARRVSTGSLLAAAAYRTLMAGAHELMTDGTSRYGEGGLSRGV